MTPTPRARLLSALALLRDPMRAVRTEAARARGDTTAALGYARTLLSLHPDDARLSALVAQLQAQPPR